MVKTEKGLSVKEMVQYALTGLLIPFLIWVGSQMIELKTSNAVVLEKIKNHIEDEKSGIDKIDKIECRVDTLENGLKELKNDYDNTHRKRR